MRRIVLIALGVTTIATAAAAQAPAEAIEKALLAVPRQAREAAMVIKWKPDFTYDTLRPGTNRMVCYDQSGLPTEQPFSVQCTSVANLARVPEPEARSGNRPRQAADCARFRHQARAGVVVHPANG
jgi:hypothetical protein